MRHMRKRTIMAGLIIMTAEIPCSCDLREMLEILKTGTAKGPTNKMMMKTNLLFTVIAFYDVSFFYTFVCVNMRQRTFRALFVLNNFRGDIKHTEQPSRIHPSMSYSRVWTSMH